MSVTSSSNVPQHAPVYFGEPGVYYDVEGISTGSTTTENPSTNTSFHPTSSTKQLQLLWLVASALVAAREGSCHHVCPSPTGLYPNVADCRCYFKCVSGAPVQKWCPPGLKFDVTTLQCAFPSKTVCAGSLVHLLPSLIPHHQHQHHGGNAMHQIPSHSHHDNKGHVHVTLAMGKPNGNNGNMMQMMQMLMMMMNQGMMGMNNQQNMMMPPSMMNMNKNMMNQNMMNQNMMNQNMMNQNMMNQNMNPNMMNQNMMNQNMNQNMMNQNMNQNMMNQNMNQNMVSQNMNQNMMNQNMKPSMMNQNMNMNMMNQMNMTGNNQGQKMQCTGGCHQPKKQISLVYELKLNKFPIRFKLFG